MAGNLKDFRRLLREYKLISDSSRVPGEFQIIAIYCYSADCNFLRALTPPVEGAVKEILYIYDVLLTDGVEKLKCFLALPLGHLVQKYVIKVGSFVEIQKAKLCYLEGEYHDSHIVQYVFLEAVKVVDYSVITFPDLNALVFLESTNYRETDLIPLVTGRKCYLYPWVPALPYTEEYDYAALEFIDNGSTQNICPLQDVADDWMRMPRPYPTIFVRVLARGIMHYYGYNQNDRSHPFMAKLMIGDSSSTCSCVLFGKTILPLYYRDQRIPFICAKSTVGGKNDSVVVFHEPVGLEGQMRAVPGTILLIENYSINKPLNPLLPRLRGDAANLPFSDIEIIVGDRTSVQVVPSNNNTFLMQIALLPTEEFSFCNRVSLEYAANESTIDVIGLITYVSLFHRFMYKHGKFYARCYLELVDSSSHLPFVAIVYDNGQRFSVEDLHPGQVLVATHMKVCHLPNEMMSSLGVRSYIKATYYTELYTTHEQSSAYVRYPAVSEVATIIRDHPNEVNYLQSNVLRAGGYPTFLKGYNNLEAYKASFGNSYAGKMIPGAYWKIAVDSLVFRERRCVTLGGFIVQVEYCDLQTVESPRPVYGWSYATSVSSRRTLFVNIKARYNLGNIAPLNSRLNEKMMFPQQYASSNEEHFKSHRKFPATDAAKWTPLSDEIENFPVLADGYYIVTIASLHYQGLLQCIFIPEPTAKPHPCFSEALSGNVQVLPLVNAGGFTSEPPRYTWDEVREISRTVSEVCDKTFVFAVELHRPKPDIIQGHLVRAYICPPDQISEALAADRIT